MLLAWVLVSTLWLGETVYGWQQGTLLLLGQMVKKVKFVMRQCGPSLPLCCVLAPRPMVNECMTPPQWRTELLETQGWKALWKITWAFCIDEKTEAKENEVA